MANLNSLVVIDLNSSGEEDILSLQEESIMEFDSDLEKCKENIKKIDEESKKLSQLQTEVNEQISLPRRMPSFKEKVDSDNRSIYVGNVDYSSTEIELRSHFDHCGSIKRANIILNKYTGHPKGFAYIEFNSEESVDAALLLHGTLFRGRPIKVMSKRTNRPGMCKTNKFPGSLKGRVFKKGPRKPAPCAHRCTKRFPNLKFVAKHLQSGNSLNY